MKIAVTGAGGMLGQDMVAAADAVHHEVAAYTRADLDVTDERAVLRAFERDLPALVVNCAAYTDVDGAETDEIKAFMINEDGARNVAAAAAAIGDDRLQKMATGRVAPESFTHGSSEQRVEWLRRGLESGDPDACETLR